MKLVKKTVKAVLIFILVVLTVGIVYEQIAQIYFNSKKPAATKFVNIAGVSTHFVKKGKGGPTVVFQSGLGGDYKIWEEIQDSLAKSTTTISYDRAGLQWSDASRLPKTMQGITRELELLLENTKCPKPYILVGHSLAGITLRPFIKEHSADVAAIVFLDVSHPLQIKNASEDLKKYLVAPPDWLVGTLVETGLARTYFTFNPFITDIPAKHPMNQHIANYFYKSYKMLLQEGRDDDLMFDEAEKITSFGDVPLTVITSAYPNGAEFLATPALQKEYLALHRSGQKDLLHLSTKSMQIMAPNSNHYVPLTDPQVVISVIKAYL